jgi:hypothetical protein
MNCRSRNVPKVGLEALEIRYNEGEFGWNFGIAKAVQLWADAYSVENLYTVREW